MKNRNCLLIVSQLCLILVMSCFIAASAQAQTPASDNQSDKNNSRVRKSPFSLSFAAFGFRSMSPRANGSSASNVNFAPMAAVPNLQVLGSGTLGRLAKWTGQTSSNSFIGDSTIFEDKFGKVGIGTDSPTSRLTVAGMIQTTMGGVKFPDGTVQTTAALGGLQFVFTDSTLHGDGTSNGRDIGRRELWSNIYSTVPPSSAQGNLC